MPDPTVTIDTYTYTVYADIDTANQYMDGAFHGQTWRDADTDDQKRGLVTATRLLDRQIWQDAYDTFAERLAVPNIVNACMELALALLDGSEVQNQQTTQERVRTLQAGSVQITNFRAIDPVVQRWPQIVQELLRPYLGTSDTTLYPKATGVDDKTIFPVDLGFTPGGL